MSFNAFPNLFSNNIFYHTHFILEHEKRLFDAAEKAAESEFFKQNVLFKDAERHRLERERGQ